MNHHHSRQSLRTCRLQLFVAAIVFLGLQLHTHFHASSTFKRDAVALDGVDEPNPWSQLDHLVLVAGHAVLTTHAALTPESVVRDESWELEPFQRGQVTTFVEHIRRGVRLTARDSKALLLFSGGETRQGAGPRSEAQSYWEVADAMRWDGVPRVRERALTEEHARDSFENVLFSLCRFREVTGRYPEHVTVVSFGFKRERFVHMHRAALRFPTRRFHFVGIDPAGGVPQAVRDGERLNSASHFGADPYGCLDASLVRKRAARNPFHSSPGYPKACPELAALFDYCSKALFPGALPWDDRGTHIGWAPYSY